MMVAAGVRISGPGQDEGTRTGLRELASARVRHRAADRQLRASGHVDRAVIRQDQVEADRIGAGLVVDIAAEGDARARQVEATRVERDRGRGNAGQVVVRVLVRRGAEGVGER